MQNLYIKKGIDFTQFLICSFIYSPIVSIETDKILTPRSVPVSGEVKANFNPPSTAEASTVHVTIIPSPEP